MNKKHILIAIVVIIIVGAGVYFAFNWQTPSLLQELDQKSLQIITPAGGLTLSYKDGQARLEGILQRSTPCVEWDVQIGGTDNLPRSFVEFAIFDKNKGMICIQMIGEPQEIIATSPAAENASYHVIFEDQTVFSGTLLR